MEQKESFSLTLDRKEGYVFNTKFDHDNFDNLVTDEPEPLGTNKGPNPARLLGQAVGNCLSASLLFCLEKSKVPVNALKTEVKGYIERSQEGFLRIQKLEVHIQVDFPREEERRISRCLSIFEDYCVVTASVRKGIQVDVRVTDQDGTELTIA